MPFVLYTDASDIAVQNGKEHVIAYFSCQLTKSEHGHLTTEKEALAAVAAIEEFYPYLSSDKFEGTEGCGRQIEQMDYFFCSSLISVFNVTQDGKTAILTHCQERHPPSTCSYHQHILVNC